MPEFNVGDKVVAHKPEDVSEAPSWVGYMDGFDGAELTIESLDMWGSNTFVEVVESEYSFNIKWLTHAEEFEGNV